LCLIVIKPNKIFTAFYSSCYHLNNKTYLAALTNNIMATGTVKFFNESKGFGFITPTSGGKEVFVHVTGLIDQIRENDEVTYDVEEGKKGPSAVNVKVG
jgi:CspA family cold shock protein